MGEKQSIEGDCAPCVGTALDCHIDYGLPFKSFGRLMQIEGELARLPVPDRNVRILFNQDTGRIGASGTDFHP